MSATKNVFWNEKILLVFLAKVIASSNCENAYNYTLHDYPKTNFNIYLFQHF